MTLNSYDEWSRLNEVVVGTATNYTAHDRELSFDLFFHDNLKGRSEWYYPRLAAAGTQTDARVRHRIKDRYLDELNEDVEGIVDTLRALDVTVHRPMTLDVSSVEVRTLAWSAAVVPPLNVRDIALVVGDEVIETPPMLRSRYFETQFLKPIFASYFGEGARWSVMPRPLMTDRSFDPSYVLSTTGGPIEPIRHPRAHPYDVGLEMMWDGAQCLRLGRDLVVNIATENHAMACDWLERHLNGRFRIHRAYKLSDSHIDSMVLPLAPGLSVAPDLVLVNDACPELARILERNRFQVVPVRHRHRRLFGGGFHCFTLDMVREGGPEDYFS
ncbi:hypothetical protein [Bradyrhizobium sp. USDA 3458]|uniref:hypothetical protein n=1 Tax=Bradyrhizobium sp. USDA 3458 TaxID=2591461 RepID=UPI001FEEB4A0|nr:hypothetical protein [Bradyrhizobium sp. USDA 3458]